MRVAFLTWRDATHPDGGGSEVFVEEVARDLARRGHQVTILCADHGRAPRDEVVDRVRFRRTGGRLTVYPRGLLWTLRNRSRLDVVVDVINGLPFWTPLVRRHGVVALIHHVHERQWRIIYPGLRGRIGWIIEGRVTPRVYRRVPHLTVSEASRRDLGALGLPTEAITVARNGLAVTRSSATRAATPTVCVLARLVPHKQIEHALALIADLRQEFPDLALDVIGDGWWRETLAREAERLGVREAVAFHGHVSDAERDRLLARSWVMVLPSVKEGWGLAVLEAAAQGTPTLAYRSAGGVQESIVDGRTGLLVDDYEGMRRETRQLLRDAGAREALGAAAQERAVSFTWKDTADVVEQVLLRALSDRRR